MLQECRADIEGPENEWDWGLWCDIAKEPIKQIMFKNHFKIQYNKDNRRATEIISKQCTGEADCLNGY